MSKEGENGYLRGDTRAGSDTRNSAWGGKVVSAPKTCGRGRRSPQEGSGWLTISKKVSKKRGGNLYPETRFLGLRTAKRGRRKPGLFLFELMACLREPSGTQRDERELSFFLGDRVLEKKKKIAWLGLR